MDKPTRNRIEKATQKARDLLKEEFSIQLEGTYDIRRTGEMPEVVGPHLSQEDRLVRQKILSAIHHKQAAGMTALEAVQDYVRDAAFTTLNRFVALKMLEARELVQECVSKGDESSGYRVEFCGCAPGLALLPDGRGYRLYLECLFDELSQEVHVLFDRRDVASLLWPRRTVLQGLVQVLNDPDLSTVWAADETIGWVYQYFNSSEERREMREKSQAPRNSRELAVRNQFFTPRYVVEFLTDNSLGRTWYEMRNGDTALKDRCPYLVYRPVEVFLQEGEKAPADKDGDRDLSREEMFKQPVYISHRPRKDPRDLRVLDPACGSGHFLLYCFDVLQTIYQEAWGDEASPPSAETGKILRLDYTTLEELRWAVPILILRHNLHGIDIDPRCVQIAGLALWMRVQRAFHEVKVPRDKREVRQANVVLAEPMPGEKEMVKEFAATLRPAVVGTLFEEIVEQMELAGELGSLLRIEESLQSSIARARTAFQEEQARRKGTAGYLTGFEPPLFSGKVYDFMDLDDETFFHTAEARIKVALESYADQASAQQATARRLFAEDARYGVALLDLLRQRYDVVLMNPPFGEPSKVGKASLERGYPRTKNDIYAAFVERGIHLLHPRGLLGAITSRTGFFLSSFQKWREEILLKEAPPLVFADLGHGVMDAAMVEAAAYCLEKGPQTLETAFLRALDAEDKPAVLLAGIRDPTAVIGTHRFDVATRVFGSAPSSPFTTGLVSVYEASSRSSRPWSRTVGATELVCKRATMVASSALGGRSDLVASSQVDSSLMRRAEAHRPTIAASHW